MLSFADMLKTPISEQTKKKPRRSAEAARYAAATRRARADGRYRLHLEGTTLTTGQIAAKLGISHMGCLSSLYSLEERGLIKRVGTAPREKGHGRGSTLWTWNIKKEEA